MLLCIQVYAVMCFAVVDSGISMPRPVCWLSSYCSLQCCLCDKCMVLVCRTSIGRVLLLLGVEEPSTCFACLQLASRLTAHATMYEGLPVVKALWCYEPCGAGYVLLRGQCCLKHVLC